MAKISPVVLVLDGPEVITGSGSFVPAPEPAAPDVILDRLAAALGSNGQVLLTDREPRWDSIISGSQIGAWKVSGSKAWYTAHRDGVYLRIGILREIPDHNDPLLGENPTVTAIRHQVFARLVGVPFYADGGSTSALLLDATMRVKGRQPLRKWEDEYAPSVREDAWPGLGGWESPHPRKTSGPLVSLDCNAQYLWGVCGCYLPLDGLARTGAIGFNPSLSGYWQIRMPANPEPRLPHPAGKNADDYVGKLRWCTTPTVELLAKLGCDIAPADSWTCTRDRCRRAMDPWYNALRDARAAVLDATDADSKAIQRAIKDCYSRGIAHLDRKPDRRWYRPDWRATLFARSRVAMWDAMYKAGRESDVWPVAVATDSADYEDHDAPQAFKIGPKMGMWKVRD